MATHALRTRYRIVLVDYFADPNFLWHMRVLLVHGGAGKWVAASPDHDLELLDLTDKRVIPLRAGERFPDRVRNQVYAFDEFEPGEEDILARAADEYAVAVGFTVVGRAAGGGVWRISDTAHEKFGEELPAAAVDDADTVISRGSAGVAKLDDVWVTIERVGDGKLDAWKLAKAVGPGRDRRLIGEQRDARGKRFITEAEAMTRWRGTPVDDTPLPGPSVTLAFFEALRTSGQTLLDHHANWVSRSGVAAKGAAAREHFLLSEGMRLEVTLDQLDPTQLVTSEFRIRRLIMIETAVERNARNPDYDGLEAMLSSSLAPSGAAVTEGFTQWLTNRQRDQAQIMKQGRMLRDE